MCVYVATVGILRRKKFFLIWTCSRVTCRHVLLGTAFPDYIGRNEVACLGSIDFPLHLHTSFVHILDVVSKYCEEWT